jgi:hypothetical protein
LLGNNNNNDNYLVLGDNLIQLSNVSIPFFLLDTNTMNNNLLNFSRADQLSSRSNKSTGNNQNLNNSKRSIL